MQVETKHMKSGQGLRKLQPGSANQAWEQLMVKVKTQT